MAVWTVELDPRGPMLPTAEHLLNVGMRRAVAMIQADQLGDAMRALAVAAAAADLIQAEAPALEERQP